MANKKSDEPIDPNNVNGTAGIDKPEWMKQFFKDYHDRFIAWFSIIFVGLLVSAVAFAGKPADTITVAPNLLSPEHNATIDSIPNFDWEGIKGSSGYQLQYTNSADPDFSDATTVELNRKTTSYKPELFEEGNYLWRVRGEGKRHKAGPWSDYYQFYFELAAPDPIPDPDPDPDPTPDPEPDPDPDPTPDPDPAPDNSAVLWSTDHEQGSLANWSSDPQNFNSGNGGSFDNSNCIRPNENSSDPQNRENVLGRGVSKDVAHSGEWSMKMTLDTSSSGGCRQFRWGEAKYYDDGGNGLYYSAWLYFPERIDIQQWSNFAQFKSKTSSVNDPFWILQAFNHSDDGNMFWTLYWWNGLSIPGPQAGDGVGGKSFSQSIKDIPIGQWTHIEMYLRQSSDFDGQITLWQDGTEIINVDNVRTKYPDGDNQWSVNVYSGPLTPTNATMYVDDAAVSTQRLGIGFTDFTDR